MTIRLIIVFFLMFSKAYSQTLIPAATKVRSAFEKLSADINSKKLQRDYITAFPADTKTFLSVFQTENFDQLYKRSDTYIFALEKCAGTFPTEVISKCVDVGRSLVWDADAVGYLQDISINLATRHLRIFIVKFKTLTKTEQDSLIAFYADVENYSAYPEYQELSDRLVGAGEKDIAKRFEVARTKRMKQEDH